jgi:hypothetical protein
LAFLLGFTLAYGWQGVIRHSYGRNLEGKYDGSPNGEWFRRQTNKENVPCCDIADGQRVDDADWKWENDKYWVHTGKDLQVNGCAPDAWCEVPDKAVISPKDRPIDYAMVWLFQGRIYCFMQGAGS